jgi:hypothetical protein
VQAALAVNEWRQRAYEWQACAEWWQAYAQGQAYAQWQSYAQFQAYAQWQRSLLATPSSPCNDNRATNVDTPTPTSKRNRKPTLRSDIEDVKRAGLPIRSVQRTPDGHTINIGEPIINTVSDNDNNDDAPDRSEWH